jgi:hypothetical protein
MGLERCVVDAVLIEKRSPTEIAKAYGISRSWLYALIARVSGATRPSSLTRADRDPVRGRSASRSSPPSSNSARSSSRRVTTPDPRPSPTTSPGA